MLLVGLNCNKPQRSHKEYIEFSHTGIVTSILHPLFISQRKINIPLNKWDLKGLKDFVGDSSKITKAKEEEYISLKFHQIVTDSATFWSIYEFVTDHNEYYTNNSHQNNGSFWKSYNIHIDNEIFHIYYKMRIDFFEDLILYLKERRCDDQMISALSHL
jgi:hypothetical protein